ncbi:adhesion G protein-coupled receptor E1-like [Trichechus inunguis]
MWMNALKHPCSVVLAQSAQTCRCSCLPRFSSPPGNAWIPAKSDNFTCSDITECLNSSSCVGNSDCVNCVGSYSCSCQAGFISRHSTCKDVDECANLRACAEQVIYNPVVSYSCFRNPGFESSSGNLTFQGLGERREGRWSYLFGIQV